MDHQRKKTKNQLGYFNEPGMLAQATFIKIEAKKLLKIINPSNMYKNQAAGNA